jgi:tetratricopeptide (TPR) repeat protein
MPNSNPVPGRKGIPARLAFLALLGAIALIAAAVVLFGRGRFSTNDLAVAARRAVEARDWPSAEARLEEWLRQDPQSAEAHFLKARRELALDQPDKAFGLFERARQLGYPEEELERYAGLIMDRGGKWDAAEPLLARAWERVTAADTEVARALLRGYIDHFRYGPALLIADQWIDRDPACAEAYLYRVEINRWLDSEAEILIRDYAAALERDPGRDDVRLAFAQTLRLAGRLEEAETEYRDCLERHPEDPLAHVGLGMTKLAGGYEKEAITFLDRGLALDPKNLTAKKGRASIALRLGDASTALALLDEAKALASDDPEIRYQRALALQRLDRKDEASEERKVEAKLRDDAKEIREIRRMMIRSPRDLGLQARAARWLLDHDHESEGLTWAERVLAAQPDHRALLELLAGYFDRKGQTGRANYYRLRLERATASTASADAPLSPTPGSDTADQNPPPGDSR